MQRAVERSMDQRVVLHGVTWPQYEAILAIRGEAGEVDAALVDWWTRFQDAPADEREKMLKPEEAPKKKRRRPRGRGRKAREGDPAAPSPAPESGDPA